MSLRWQLTGGNGKPRCRKQLRSNCKQLRTGLETRVVYVDPRGRISAEGVEFVRQSGENRTAFMKRYLDTLGDEGWEIAGLHPLVRTESSYVILKRPKAAA